MYWAFWYDLEVHLKKLLTIYESQQSYDSIKQYISEYESIKNKLKNFM
jgi:hypothetical protein